MSLKDLFEKKKTKPVVRQTKADIAKDAESIETSAEKIKKEHVYIPQVDFSEPKNFAFYGSAEKYYSDSFKTIIGTYPYDGSEEEVLEFRNGMNYVERYIFDNLYPKTNGFGLFSADGWGSANTPSGEYGVPASEEYIYVFGGPLSASAGMNAQSLKFSFSASNLYQQNIYNVIDENPAGRLGTRESNLKYNLDNGSTVEFWLQKDAFDISKTKKEVVFDLWNQTAYTDSGYGRLMVELSGNNDFTDGSPFFITANSGSTGFNNTKIGTNITTASLSSWHHYAFSFVNDRSANNIKVKFYVDGVLNDEKAIGAPINEVTGGLKAFIGAMQAPVIGGTGVSGAGKLSGSLDEFRYWKAKRTSEDVGFNYFRPVRGGTNERVSNATLGIYYKFNEGITQTSSIDSVVLDYSGRIANGQWVGYDSHARSTGSAIVLAGAYPTEEKDPIIYGIHPSVSDLRSSLELSGSLHDENNNNRFIELFPSWMKDKAFEAGDPSFDNLTQMMGVEFDKTFLLINRITELKKQNYFNDDQMAFPFIKQMLESYGLTVEDLLSAAEINEKVLNKNDTQNLENDIQDVKNKLYQNLFNNLFNIYKTKGTEKSFRNIFRCLGLDDDLIAIKIYADNTTYTLEDNYKNKLLRAVHVDHNKVDNFGATVHQWYTSSNPNTISFISGSNAAGLEDYLGFTAECKFILPSKPRVSEPHYFRTPFVTSSLFGLNTATDDDQTDLTYNSPNSANFNVSVERDSIEGRNAKFRLSSVSPTPIPELTTSFYNNLYSNTEWSIGVSMRPVKPLGNFVPGSNEVHATSSGIDGRYIVEFFGVNMLGDRVLNEFLLTASISHTLGQNFLRAPKRMYMGAHYINTTGTLVNRTDAKFDSLKYYNLHNNTASIKQHMIDQESYGRADSLDQINLFASGTLDTYIPKFKTLILNWNFRNLSSSKADGTFFVDDFSSGSVADESYGAYKGYFNKQHSGIGRFFLTSSTKVFDKVYVNSMQKQTPETTMASDMVNILERDDQRYERDSKAVRYSVHFEKSPYEAINKEILNMFSTILDFNNAVGSSVERYRQEYKSLENLRRLMFSRFQNEISVEKFISYYRWFDHAVGRMLEEFMPGSVKFEASLATLIQSHVLERNKYWTKFPTMEFKTTDPEAGLAGFEELNYDWKHGHAPVTNKQAFNSIWWKNRAERNKGLLSSSFAGVNIDREKIRMEIQSFRSASALFLAQSSSAPVGYIPVYRGREFPLRKFTKHYDFSIAESKVIHGGVNFNKNKDFHYAFNAVHPAGPVSTLSGTFVPQNVLLGFRGEDYDKQNIKDVFKPNEKKKVFGKVLFGRDYEDGTNYTNTDMNHAFPFNVYESTVSGGYGDLVNTKYATGTIITNLHSDTYGPDLEVPMQGPFTEKWVGGLQARHVDINNFSGGLDDHSTRPEAWKLLLGTCGTVQGGVGAIGLVGADYPWPTNIANIEAIKHGTAEAVYPMTSSRKAHYYRDEFAKRPLNIKNIRTMTGAVSHGNYRFNYEVVHSVGANQNPRAFLRNTPVLPFQISPGRNAVIKVSSIGSTNASDGNTVTLSDGIVTKVLTFKTIPSSPDHVLIGGTSRNTLGNLQSHINLSQSWGLRAYNWSIRTGVSDLDEFIIENIAYQGNFTNTTPSTTWSNITIGLSGSSPDIAKTGDITNVLTIRNIFRDQYGHKYTEGITRFENRTQTISGIRLSPYRKFDYDYDVSYLTGASAPENKTIIKSRFAAPGGIETDTAGYRDFRGDEYSAYTPVPYRNLRVIRPDQPTHKIIPDISGSSALEQGGPGIRVSDQNGFDIGLRSNLARHTARFGRDSLIYPPSQYRLNDSPDTYNLRESFIGYGSKAVYRAQRDLEGWWRLDNYLMQGAITGNVDSSGKGRSFAFASAAEAPTSANGGRYVDINKPLISRIDYENLGPTGPSPYVQTASFANFPFTYTHDRGVKFPIGGATLWQSLIGADGSKSFTFAAWIRLQGNSHTDSPHIFDFGGSDVALFVDQTTGDGKLGLQYFSQNGSGGTEQVLAMTPSGSLKGEFPSFKTRWIHVAVTANLQGTDIRPTVSLSSSTDSIFGGQRVKFYINGERQTTLGAGTGSIDTAGSFYGMVSQDCYIGNNVLDSRPFHGNIADAAVWSVPLAEEDIVAIYNASQNKIAAWGDQRNTGSVYSRNYGVPPNLYGAGPGSTYDQCAALHKIHRNSKRRVINQPQLVRTKHQNSLYIPDCGGDTHTISNSSSVSRDQWEVTTDSQKQMLFSMWVFDSIANNVNNKRAIFSLNTSLTSSNAGSDQILSLQIENSNVSPRELIIRLADGTAGSNKYISWKSSIELNTGEWTHIAFATDGVLGNGSGDAPKVYVNGAQASLTTKHVVNNPIGKYHTEGGGKFTLGGGFYRYNSTTGWNKTTEALRIDEFAMWQGIPTSSILSSQWTELYNSGEYHNLNKTSLGQPYMYYTFDDAADPPSGSIADGSLVKDQSGNQKDLVVTIDGTVTGDPAQPRFLLISSATFGTPIDNTSFVDNFKTVREYDNYYVQHQIPRTDAQYAWITASFTGSETAEIKVGYAPFDTWEDGLDNNGNSPYNTLLSSSLVNGWFESNNRIAAHYTNVYAIRRRAPARIHSFKPYGITTPPNRRPDTYTIRNIKRIISAHQALDEWGTLMFLNTVGPSRQLKQRNPITMSSAYRVNAPFALSGSTTSAEFVGGFGPTGKQGSLKPIFSYGTEGGAINKNVRSFAASTGAVELLNPIEDRLNLYLTKLNGPYGAPNFKFIRNQDNKILQNSRFYNLYTAIGTPDSLEGTASAFARRSSNVIMFDRVSPVTSKYGTLVYGFGTTKTFKNKFNQNVEIEGTSYFRASFANQKGYFNSDKLNMFLGLDKKENLTFYDKFKNLYLDGALEGELSPIERMEFVTYNETIYPSDANMYSRFNRQRVNFDMNNWNSSYSQRITSTTGSALHFQFIPGESLQNFGSGPHTTNVLVPSQSPLGSRTGSVFTYKIESSKWPIDTMGQYLSSSQGDMCLVNNRSTYRDAAAAVNEPWNPGGKSKIIDNPAGELLNNYTHWHGGTITNADIYYDRHIQSSLTKSMWSATKQLSTSMRFAFEFITASCLYALKNVSFHSHSVYAWNRPNVVFYQTASDDGDNQHGTTTKAIGLPVKYPNRKGDNALMAYNAQTAYKYSGYGDAPFVANETAGVFLINTGSTLKNDTVISFLSTSAQPFYDTYEDFALDIRTKNKDMSVIPEFIMSEHIDKFSKNDSVIDATLPDMFEIPGAHSFETDIDGTPLDSRSSSGSFFEIYSNSDFLEHFDIIKDDHKDFMEPTTLTLRCTAIKKFMPYKGFYPAERTLQLYKQFMQSYGTSITGSRNFLEALGADEGAFNIIGGSPGSAGGQVTGERGEPVMGAIARPILTPLFAPGILFNSIKSGIGVDFPILAMGGPTAPKSTDAESSHDHRYDNGFGARAIEAQASSTNAPRFDTVRIDVVYTKGAIPPGASSGVDLEDFCYDNNTITEFGAKATQNKRLTANKITASLTLPPFYSDHSGSVDFYTGSGAGHDRRGGGDDNQFSISGYGDIRLGTGNTNANKNGAGNFTLQDRYLQIVGSNQPGTLKWSKRIPFEAIIKPHEFFEDLHVADMFVNDHTALVPTGKVTRFNTAYLTGTVPGAKLLEPSDEIYTLMADNFCGAVPDFYLDQGELATITSKKESELNLFIKSGSIFATRLRMRRSMNKPRNYANDLKHVFHRTSSINFALGSVFSAKITSNLEIEPGDATKCYFREEGQKKQIADYEIFQDPIYDTGLYETLTMYNRPGAFGPPVTGREPNCFAGRVEIRATQAGGQHIKTYGTEIDFDSSSGSRGTHAVRDSSNGFNPAFTPPYYDGHAVLDIVFRAPESRKYTIAEIIRESKTQSWRWDPGWLVVRGTSDTTVMAKRILPSASFTLIPGELYYNNHLNRHAGITGSLGTSYNVQSGSACPTSDRFDRNTYGARSYNGAPYAGQHINETSMQLEHCVNFNLLGSVPSTTTDNDGNTIIRDVGEDDDKVWVIQPKWETPILNFKDAKPFPQGEGLSTDGIGPRQTLNNRSSLVASTGMWHQFGKLPNNNEGIYLEMIDIPKNWIDGHWSLRKNMNRGLGVPNLTGSNEFQLKSRPGVVASGDPATARSVEVNAFYGYNTPYTCSAYNDIASSDEVQSLKDLLGFKSSAQSNNLTLAGPGQGPKVRLGEIAEKKVVSEAVVAIPFIERGREKFFFEIDKFFIDMARSDRRPPGGVPDAGDSIKDMVEKMERYVFPPSMDFITYPEITPFSMYIFEFHHEFDRQDLANMWQNISPKTARSFEIAESKIRHDFNQDELMGFALGKSDEAFMDEVRWMVFKVKQKSMVSYEDKIAGKNLPKLSFKISSPMQIMPKFSKFKIRRVRLQNQSLKINTSTITPTFKFGRSLTERKTEVDLSFNWPYDFFSLVEMAKIKASITFRKADDIEVQQQPQVSGITPLGPFTPQNPQVSPAPSLATQFPSSLVKSSTNTRAVKRSQSIPGGKQKQVSVTKKSNTASKVIPGLTFSKVIKF